jgi:uncharacterized protein YciI
MRSVLIILFFFVCFSAYPQSKSYLIVFLNKKTDADARPKSELDSIFKGHMRNIDRLAAEGKLLAAGPFVNGGGIFIMNSTSVEQVREWIGTDPGVQAKRWDVEILPYIPRVGGICPVKAPYEMTEYTFVRFNPVKGNTTVPSQKTLEDHDGYLKTLSGQNIVTEVSFGEHAGGILVSKGELDELKIANAPAVKAGVLSFKVKKLFIARGSFCEQ